MACGMLVISFIHFVCLKKMVVKKLVFTLIWKEAIYHIIRRIEKRKET